METEIQTLYNLMSTKQQRHIKEYMKQVIRIETQTKKMIRNIQDIDKIMFSTD